VTPAAWQTDCARSATGSFTVALTGTWVAEERFGEATVVEGMDGRELAVAGSRTGENDAPDEEDEVILIRRGVRV